MVAHTPPKWNERPERLLPGGGLHGPGGSGEEDMSMISSVIGMAARNTGHDSRALTSRRMSARDRVWLKSHWHAPMHPNNKFNRRPQSFQLFSITASMRTGQQRARFAMLWLGQAAARPFVCAVGLGTLIFQICLRLAVGDSPGRSLSNCNFLGIYISAVVCARHERCN